MEALGGSPKRLLPVGRIAGHRGRHGEVTVRVFDGDAELWNGVSEVWIAQGPTTPGQAHEVRASRAYRDRLVLRLAGVDDASAAEALRGRHVAVDADAAPPLPAGQHYRATLVGMEVHVGGAPIGRVVDLLVTAGPDLLVVRPAEPQTEREPREILVPWVEEIVEDVDEQRRVIRIRPPEGLLDLDREGPA